MANARLLAVQLLDKTFYENSFSNIVLDTALDSSQLSVQDKKFCTVLYYGVIERKITLDYIISQYCRQAKKLDITVSDILRLGIYQLLYMNSVPESAAVNESVKLAVRMRCFKFKGLVNAVLRNFIRDDKKFKLPSDRYQKLSVEYSAPIWLVKKLTGEYGLDFAVSVLESSVKKPPVTLRLNNLKADEKTLMENTGDIEVTAVDGIENCYRINGGDIISEPAFEKGFFHIQDTASQLCCMALAPEENDIVVDVCSAPGGKAFTIAEMMNGTGTVYAFDLHENRVKLIEKGAERLGISNIKAASGDALIFNDNIPQADRVLCDVPCSGLGVIRRKPEIKYKNPEDFENLPDIQLRILENASRYVKKGGELVYSTCTLSKAENDDVIEKFLENHSGFEKAKLPDFFSEKFSGFKAVLSPEYYDCDGFFISKIKRVR